MTVTDTFAPIKTAFHEWYAQFQISDDVEQRQARLKSIVALVKKITFEEMEVLVRIAFGSKRGPAPTAVAKFREMFISADENFPLGSNDRELQILAAASLV